MPESFGARLRQQRERQNISLVTIAEQTKIKASLLEALERDDVSRWPSGIFRRAYVRAYAHAIGLSPDDVLREFVERYPDPVQESEPVASLAAAHNLTPHATGVPTRLHFLVESALASFSRLRRNSAENLPPAADAEVGSAIEQPEGSSQQPTGELRLLEFANVCTELARIQRADQLQSWLRKAASVLDATGLVVWVWHEAAGALIPVFVHGYSEQVIAQLPALTTDADNVTAAAFRSGVACVEPGTEHVNGALAVPLPTPGGSSGVLAVELRAGGERMDSVLVFASVLAAMLAQLLGERPRAPAEDLDEAPIPVSAAPSGSNPAASAISSSVGST
jgi:transcriptional regulator with XRE-family HTH domain